MNIYSIDNQFKKPKEWEHGVGLITFAAKLKKYESKI